MSNEQNERLDDAGAAFTGGGFAPPRVNMESAGWAPEGKAEVQPEAVKTTKSKTKETSEEVEDTEEEETEEEVEDDEIEEEEEDEPEAEAEVEAAQEEEAPANISQKSQRRFQQLARERNELREQNKTLLEAVQRSTQATERIFTNAEKVQKEHLTQREELVLRERLAAQGYQPGEFAHDLALNAYKEAEAAKKALATLEERITRGEQQTRVAAFKSALDASISKSLTGYTLPKSFSKDQLSTQALALAAAQGLTPDQAAGVVLSPFLAVLAKAPKAVKKKAIPSDQRQAHEIVATRGKTAGRKPGDKVSGKQARKSVKDFEGGDRWD